jgi:hypothetical protein
VCSGGADVLEDIDFYGSVHHSTIRKEKSNRMQQRIKILLFHIYMKLNMFRTTPPIIRSLKLHWQPLVFHTWKVVGRVVGGPPTKPPTTFHV